MAVFELDGIEGLAAGGLGICGGPSPCLLGLMLVLMGRRWCRALAHLDRVGLLNSGCSCRRRQDEDDGAAYCTHLWRSEHLVFAVL
jgi:hypothetical protein